MRVELRITSGSRAGQRELFDKSVISIGRHPSNDFRFHPELDPDVSSKHAELRVLESKTTIHDLKSTNGTFVNGQRVEGERAIFSGDLLAFGLEGPKVEFRTVSEVAEPATTRIEKDAPAKPAAAGAVAGAKPAAPRRNTMERIAEAVEAQTGKLQTMVLGLAVLVFVGVGGAWWIGHRDAAKAQALLEAALKRNDSLSVAFDQSVSSMRGKVKGLDSALIFSKADGKQLRARIRSEMAKGGDADIGNLASQLSAAEGRQRALVTAARVDYEAISTKNGPAMVFIAVKHADGESVSGSGFNVTPSGLIVTNRHVVLDEKGQPAVAVAVAFEGTTGEWKHAHVLKVSPTDELAFIKIDGGGPYPVVAGVAKSANLHVGTPAAIIGYPLGTSTAGMGGEINKLTPRSTLGIATVSKVLAETLQLDAYAAEGSSGSPVFDARGFVVGVIYGGQSESHGRIVYAVPGEKLVAQMPSEGTAIVR
jgi:pSer/pThr/pTyr-binding forkhead associated (FHA) protein/V8-like Glu-specific endopeptidase